MLNVDGLGDAGPDDRVVQKVQNNEEMGDNYMSKGDEASEELG
jgi:hypothetical protein